MARQACPAVRGFDGGEEVVAVAPCGKMHHPVSAAHIQVRSTQCVLVGWNEIDDGLAGALPMNTVFRIGFADMIKMLRPFGPTLPAQKAGVTAAQNLSSYTLQEFEQFVATQKAKRP